MEPQVQNPTAPWIVPAAIVVGFGLIALAIYFSSAGRTPKTVEINTPASTAQKKTIRPVDQTDYIKGNPQAPILIVEYSDYECPYCKNFHEVMRRIMEEYGTNGKVAWVYRQFPISDLHPNSSRLSLSALCVGELGGNDAFWKFTDSIFQERGLQEPTNPTRVPEFAENAGVSRADLTSCLNSGRHEETLKASLTDGANMGINGTPHSFVIVGNQIAPIAGAQSYDIMKQTLDSLLSMFEVPGTAPSTPN